MRLILRMWNYNNTHLLRKIFRFFKWQILCHASLLPVAAFFALAHPSPIPSLCLLWEVECIEEDVVGWVGGWGKKGPLTTRERLPPTLWPGSLCNQHKSIKYRTSCMCNSLSLSLSLSLSPCMVLETMWCQKLKDTLSSVVTNAEEKSCWNLRLKRKEGTLLSSEMDHKTFLLWSVTR